MPQTKSQIKNIKITLRNRSNNKRYKLAIRQAIKKYLISIQMINNNGNHRNSDNLIVCQDNLSIVYKKIDKAVNKNILHRNTASRRKSKLAKLLQ